MNNESIIKGFVLENLRVNLAVPRTYETNCPFTLNSGEGFLSDPLLINLIFDAVTFSLILTNLEIDQLSNKKIVTLRTVTKNTTMGTYFPLLDNLAISCLHTWLKM